MNMRLPMPDLWLNVRISNIHSTSIEKSIETVYEWYVDYEDKIDIYNLLY